MQEEVWDNNIAHGWFEKDRSFGEGIALIHSEASEALDAYREFGLKDVTAKVPPNGFCIHMEELAHCGQRHPKPVGVGSEFADILIRLLDECQRTGIDLEFEYERKMAYNRTRPIRHGGKRL